MRTFQQFIEATEKDLIAMGASKEARDELERRSKRRGNTGFGSSGSTGSHFHQKQDKKPGALMKRPVSRAEPYRGSAIIKSGSSAITKPADKGAAIVRSKNYKEPRASRPDEKQVGERPGSSRGINYEKPKKSNKFLKNTGRILKKGAGVAVKGTGMATKAGAKLLKKAAQLTKTSSVGTSSSGNLSGPTISQGGRTSK